MNFLWLCMKHAVDISLDEILTLQAFENEKETYLALLIINSVITW